MLTIILITKCATSRTSPKETQQLPTVLEHLDLCTKFFVHKKIQSNEALNHHAWQKRPKIRFITNAQSSWDEKDSFIQ